MESIINDLDMRIDVLLSQLRQINDEIDRLQELRRFAEIENGYAEIGRDTIAIQTGKRPL